MVNNDDQVTRQLKLNLLVTDEVVV